jgi:hypothetical protein
MVGREKVEMENPKEKEYVHIRSCKKRWFWRL